MPLFRTHLAEIRRSYVFWHGIQMAPRVVLARVWSRQIGYILIYEQAWGIFSGAIARYVTMLHICFDSQFRCVDVRGQFAKNAAFYRFCSTNSKIYLQKLIESSKAAVRSSRRPIPDPWSSVTLTFARAWRLPICPGSDGRDLAGGPPPGMPYSFSSPPPPKKNKGGHLIGVHLSSPFLTFIPCLCISAVVFSHRRSPIYPYQMIKTYCLLFITIRFIFWATSRLFPFSEPIDMRFQFPQKRGTGREIWGGGDAFIDTSSI